MVLQTFLSLDLWSKDNGLRGDTCDNLPSSFGPVTVFASPFVRDPHVCGCPKPTIDDGWLQILPLTTLEVAFPSASPNVRNVV